MTIRRKILLVMQLSIVLGAALGMIFLGAGWKTDLAVRREQELNRIADGIYRLTLLGQEFSLHPHEARAHEQWLKLHGALGARLRELRLGAPAEETALERLRHEHGHALQLVQRLRALAGEDPAGSPAVAAEQRERAVHRFSFISHQMISTILSLQRRMHAELTVYRRRIDLTALALGGTLTTAIAWLAYLIGQSIVGPLLRLRQGTEIIGAGNLAYRVGMLTRDEIGELSRAFDRMLNRLQEVTSSREELQREVDTRVRAEQALRRSEESLKKAQAIAHLGNWEWDIRSGRLSWSDEIYRIFGWKPREVAATYAAFVNAIHPADRARVAAAIEAALAGQPYEVEHRIVLPDGRERVVHEVGEVLFGEAGKPLTMHGTAYDITERKRAEEAQRELNRQLTGTVAELRRREREMILIKRLNDLLQTCRTLEEAYPLISGHVGELLGALSGGIALFTPASRNLQAVARWGDPTALESLGSAEECWAVRTGQVHVPARSGEGPAPCRHLAQTPARDCLCIPLEVKDEALGVLHLIAAEGDTIGHEQRQLAVTVCDVLKLALSNIKLRETLREQSIRDPLTGLFNRRYLDETLPRELHRAARTRSCLCIAMADVDHFKRFNDTYGHDAGDEVLKAVARVLRDGLRESDIVCRYGGEEFTLILPDCALHNAREHLDQLRAQVKQLQLTRGDRTLPPITVSMGLARATADAPPTSEQLIGAADAALYAAKQAGRDRIEVYSGADEDEAATG